MVIVGVFEAKRSPLPPFVKSRPPFILLFFVGVGRLGYGWVGVEVKGNGLCINATRFFFLLGSGKIGPETQGGALRGVEISKFVKI